MKRCSKCGEIKSIEEFHKDSSKQDGRKPYCKACRKAEQVAYYNSNKSAVQAKNNRWHQNNKERHAELNRAWAENNAEKRREINARARKNSKRDLGKRREYNKAWVKNNRERSNQARRAAYIKRISDPLFKIQKMVRSLLWAHFQAKQHKKTSKTQTLLGCTFQDLLTHLGQKPTENAHIDHICPCAQAQNEQELLKLQHYTNLRWLPAEENLKKSDNKTPEAEEMCKKLLDREWID